MYQKSRIIFLSHGKICIIFFKYSHQSNCNFYLYSIVSHIELCLKWAHFLWEKKHYSSSFGYNVKKLHTCMFEDNCFTPTY